MRDIHLIETLKDVNPSEVKVEDALSQEVYVISPDSSLADVVDEMAAKKYGSAIVEQNGKVVGIFTVIDALQALSDLLNTRLK